MLEGLQKNAEAISKLRSTDGTTQIILDNNYCEKVIEFIKDARHDVRVCAYAWRWYEHEPEIAIQKLNIAILQAKHRGINVRCLTDTAPVMQMLRGLGLNARCVASNRMLHTKAICVDEKTLVLGSHNLTKRANTDNYEISIATQESDAVLLFVEYFDRMWDVYG